MNYLAYLLVIFIFSSSILGKPVLAAEKTADGSARLKKLEGNFRNDPRVRKIKNFLGKYQSPLLPYAEVIIEAANEYQLPWTLVVSIAGVESTFCRHIPYNSLNCWGWNNGKTIFLNYRQGIRTVSRTLRNKYFNQGLDTPEEIGPIYAPSTPSWGGKVRFFMEQVETEAFFPLLALQFSI